jgi:hypothetical protein
VEFGQRLEIKIDMAMLYPDGFSGKQVFSLVCGMGSVNREATFIGNSQCMCPTCWNSEMAVPSELRFTETEP